MSEFARGAIFSTPDGREWTVLDYLPDGRVKCQEVVEGMLTETVVNRRGPEVTIKIVVD